MAGISTHIRVPPCQHNPGPLSTLEDWEFSDRTEVWCRVCGKKLGTRAKRPPQAYPSQTHLEALQRYHALRAAWHARAWR